MAKATSTVRGTTLDGSDVRESVNQLNAATSYWVLNSAIALNSTQYSASAFAVIATNGSMRWYTATGTGGGFTGNTIATGNVAVVAAYVTQAGTHGIVFGATAGSFGVAIAPYSGVPSTAYLIGVILIKASGASAFTGGTTVLDGTNASAVFINMNGPAGIALQTAAISLVPG